MGDLDGKLALVSGGASGIGLATAERLTDEGARVVIGDVDETAGHAAADKLGASFRRLDVSRPDDWAACVSELRARHGGLDIAFLNAGVVTMPSGGEQGIGAFDIATLTDDRYRRILGVNVDGVVFGTRAVTPALEARGGGAIVVTASVAGLIAFPPDPIYTLTKHAVVGLTRALAPLLAARRITLNAVCPGGVDTNILGSSMAERARERGVRLMPPSQIADAVLHAIRSGETGALYVCLVDRPPQRYEFAPVEGLAG